MQCTYPVLPEKGQTQLRIFSGIPDCDYRVSTNLLEMEDQFVLQGIDYYSSGNLNTNDGSLLLTYSIQNLTQGKLQGSYNPRYSMTPIRYETISTPKVAQYWKVVPSCCTRRGHTRSSCVRRRP